MLMHGTVSTGSSSARGVWARCVLGLLLSIAACEPGAAAQDTGAVEERGRQQLREQLGDVPASVNPEIPRALSNAFRGAAQRSLPAVVQVAVERSPRVG